MIYIAGRVWDITPTACCRRVSALDNTANVGASYIVSGENAIPSIRCAYHCTAVLVLELGQMRSGDVAIDATPRHLKRRRNLHPHESIRHSLVSQQGEISRVLFNVLCFHNQDVKGSKLSPQRPVVTPSHSTYKLTMSPQLTTHSVVRLKKYVRSERTERSTDAKSDRLSQKGHYTRRMKRKMTLSAKPVAPVLHTHCRSVVAIHIDFSSPWQPMHALCEWSSCTLQARYVQWHTIVRTCAAFKHSPLCCRKNCTHSHPADTRQWNALTHVPHEHCEPDQLYVPHRDLHFGQHNFPGQRQHPRHMWDHSSLGSPLPRRFCRSCVAIHTDVFNANGMYTHRLFR